MALSPQTRHAYKLLDTLLSPWMYLSRQPLDMELLNQTYNSQDKQQTRIPAVADTVQHTILSKKILGLKTPMV